MYSPTYGRDEIPARPEALSDEPALSFAVNSRKMDRALAFDVPNHLTDRIFRRYRQQHVNVVGHQVPLFDAAFSLLGQLLEYRAEMSLQLAIQRLPAVFGYENDVIFAVPLGVI